MPEFRLVEDIGDAAEALAELQRYRLAWHRLGCDLRDFGRMLATHAEVAEYLANKGAVTRVAEYSYDLRFYRSMLLNMTARLPSQDLPIKKDFGADWPRDRDEPRDAAYAPPIEKGWLP